MWASVRVGLFGCLSGPFHWSVSKPAHCLWCMLTPSPNTVLVLRCVFACLLLEARLCCSFCSIVGVASSPSIHFDVTCVSAFFPLLLLYVCVSVSLCICRRLPPLSSLTTSPCFLSLSQRRPWASWLSFLVSIWRGCLWTTYHSPYGKPNTLAPHSHY